MAEFHPLGLHAGVWSGTLTAPEAPRRVLLIHHGAAVGRVTVTPETTTGEWRIAARLPAEMLSDGTTTLLLMADEGDEDAPLTPEAERLGSLTIIAGEPLDDDLRAEIDLLRAEVDLLKRLFRRMAAQM